MNSEVTANDTEKKEEKPFDLAELERQFDLPAIELIRRGDDAAKSLADSGRKTLGHWMAVAEMIEAARRNIMRIQGINRPQGKQYATAMSEFLRGHGIIPNIVRAGNTALLTRMQRCLENRPLIMEWLASDKVSPSQRVAWNHPDTVWSQYQKSLTQGVLGSDYRPPNQKDVAIQTMRLEIDSKTETINDLGRQIAELEQAKADQEWQGAEPEAEPGEDKPEATPDPIPAKLEKQLQVFKSKSFAQIEAKESEIRELAAARDKARARLRELKAEKDEWKARAEKAEAELAELKRAVHGAMPAALPAIVAEQPEPEPELELPPVSKDTLDNYLADVIRSYVNPDGTLREPVRFFAESASTFFMSEVTEDEAGESIQRLRAAGRVSKQPVRRKGHQGTRRGAS